MSKLFRQQQENINDFAQAVEATRKEGTGVSINDIAKCFQEYFDEEEINILIRKLKDRKSAEKELFDTVYQWGRIGIVTDEKCNTFQALVKAIRMKHD